MSTRRSPRLRFSSVSGVAAALFLIACAKANTAASGGGGSGGVPGVTTAVGTTASDATTSVATTVATTGDFTGTTTSSTTDATSSATTTTSVGTTTSTTSSATTTTGTSSGTGGTGPCTEITLGALSVNTADGTEADYVAPSMPDMGDPTDADMGHVEFYGPDVDPTLNGDATGTFDLSMGGDSNYSTCSRCVLLAVDPSTPGKIFFQQSGSLEIDTGSDQLNGVFTGTLTNATLIEVTIDSNNNFTSTPVPGGACVHIASATLSVASNVPPGWTCDPSYYGDGSCDCGCGVADPDCADATVGSCDFCDDTGSCSTDACPGTINPTNNVGCN